MKKIVYSTRWRTKQNTSAVYKSSISLPYPILTARDKLLISMSQKYLGHSVEIDDNRRRAVVVRNGTPWKIQKEGSKLVLMSGKERIMLDKEIKVAMFFCSKNIIDIKTPI